MWYYQPEFGQGGLNLQFMNMKIYWLIKLSIDLFIQWFVKNHIKNQLIQQEQNMLRGSGAMIFLQKFEKHKEIIILLFNITFIACNY